MEDNPFKDIPFETFEDDRSFAKFVIDVIGQDSPFAKFVFAYLELIEQIGIAKAGEALLLIAEITGVVKPPPGTGRPRSDLFPQAGIYAHQPLKKEHATGNEARMLRRAYQQRVKEHGRVIKTMMRDNGLTEEEAEDALDRGILLTLALEAAVSGQKPPE